MPTYIRNQFIIEMPKQTFLVFITSTGDIMFANENECGDAFELTKEDWQNLKEFIDQQLSCG